MRWKIVFWFLLLAVVIGALNGFRSGIWKWGSFLNTTKTETASPLLPKNVKAITKIELQALLKEKKIQILDARPKTAFLAGHISNAVNVPSDELPAVLDSLRPPLDEKLRTIIYCDGGTCYSSIHEAKILSSLGFTRLEVYLGGWDDWIVTESTGVKK
jgi:ArsR family transcriptional regulator